MNNEQKPTQNGPEFWRSLEQYNGSPDFAERAETEFQSSPLRNEDGKDGIARREFLKLMGASIALATTACVRRPAQHIIPYAQAPKEITPGVANFYASTWFDGVEGYGVLVKTLEGRPIKLEGNPHYPLNEGALPARAHAEILSLYDPDRLKAPVRNLPNKDRSNRETISAKWEDLDAKVVEELGKGGVVVLTSTLPSPSSQAILADFSKAYSARLVQWDSLTAESVREAGRLSYGKAVLPRYRVDQAKMVVGIDADILGTYLSSVEFNKAWSKARKPGKGMMRFVMFESGVSLTGLNADDRVRIKPSQQIDVVLGLAAQIAKISQGAASVPAGVQTLLSQYANVAADLGVSPELFTKIARQLWEARGESLVIAGGLTTQTAEAVELQVAVNLLNSILGNDGKTVDHDVAPYATYAGSNRDMAQLIADMEAGKVKTLVIHNINPAYGLPTDSGFTKALAKVAFVVYTGNFNDETGKYANYIAPAGYSLESWGDYELQAGLISIQQPTIRPLHDTRSFEESLHAWTAKASGAPARVKEAATWYDYLRANWKTSVYPRALEGKGKSFDDFWYAVLQQGVVTTGERNRVSGARSFSAAALKSGAKQKKSGYELALYPSVQVADGRYANVSWMQELPDPVTKMVWDNYLMVSPAAARKEGLREGDIVEVKVGEKSLRAPVHIQPGLHDEVLALAVGYGRSAAGKVGNGIGVNAYQLASFNAGQPLFAGLSASLKKTGERYTLVSTQEHHSMEGRQIVVETTNEAFMKDAGSGIHRHKIFSIWPDHQYNKHKWGMAIDLNSCTGCSACVVACQSENNIPVVGKKYVMDGREMHWIRIDRYYKGDPESVEAVFQPMLCQHCETAPCETVCPVLATVHNDEGLNDMVYNRCVGTRYCSNNCPYKVRRFNWFNYAKREAPLHMALNPDVTVRSRGVMEKCTFCVHRIRQTVNAAKGNTLPGQLKDGELKTACQQTCPTNAIVFGDLNDKESAVAKLFQEGRTYGVLEELNTQPRVRYMSRVRNADRVASAHHGHGEEKSKQQQHEGEHA